MFENDLYQLLSTNASVIAALGGNNYVWKGAVPKGQPDSPALVFQVIYNDTPYTAGGTVNFQTKRVQFDSYASTYTALSTLSDTVRNLLSNITGSLGTTSLQGTFVESEMDMPEEPGDTGYILRRKLEILFQYYDLTTPQPVSPTLPVPTYGANAVFIQGVGVSTAAPTNGQSLVYNSTTGLWTPTTGAAGGGTNATQIQGVNVSVTAPLDGQVLVYSAAQLAWVPVSIINCGTF